MLQWLTAPLFVYGDPGYIHRTKENINFHYCLCVTIRIPKIIRPNLPPNIKKSAYK